MDFEALPRDMVRALRGGNIRSEEDGWVCVRALARYVKSREKDVLAVVSSSWRLGDEELYFRREV